MPMPPMYTPPELANEIISRSNARRNFAGVAANGFISCADAPLAEIDEASRRFPFAVAIVSDPLAVTLLLDQSPFGSVRSKSSQKLTFATGQPVLPASASGRTASPPASD